MKKLYIRSNKKEGREFGTKLNLPSFVKRVPDRAGVFMIEYSRKLKPTAQKLRREMTPWERKLWYLFLKKYNVPFARQKTLGRYIVDFYCFSAKLVIELDGSGHYKPEQKEYDNIRTQFLESAGLMVLRFSNYDVDKSFYEVCTKIDEVVKIRIKKYQKSV